MMECVIVEGDVNDGGDDDEVVVVEDFFAFVDSIIVGYDEFGIVELQFIIFKGGIRDDVFDCGDDPFTLLVKVAFGD